MRTILCALVLSLAVFSVALAESMTYVLPVPGVV